MADEDMSSTSGPSATIEGVKIQLLYPQSQLVSVKLNEANFLVWRTQILTAIRGYGLEEYLSLDAQIPDKFVVDNTQSQVINLAFTLWNRQDQILASWLLSSLSENILPLMIGLNTSSEIWSVLEKNFASQSKAKTLQYKLQLQTTKKGNMSMREYLAKIKMCCDLLATTGNFVNESDHVMHILAGLGPEYDLVVVTVTAGASTFGLNDVQALLLSFEARLENSMSVSAGGMINTDGSQPSVNLVAQDGNYRRNFSNQSYATRGRGSNGFRGGRRGAFRGRGGRGQGSKIICQVCHISGHSADRCWHRYDQSYGAQSGFQKNDSNTADGVQIRNPSLNMVHMPRNNNSNEEGWWYPDSGASSHVTSDLNSLQSPSEYNGPNKLQMGNGQNEHISHIGNGSLHCVHSDKMFHLNDLLHVPGITKNLISVSRFAHDNNVYFEFHPMFCLVKDQATQQVLLKGIVKEGLYRFNFSHGSESRSKEAQFKFNPYVFASSVCNNLDISLWHKRFGHCSYDIAKKALRDCNILFSNKNCDSSICHSCILAKSHKLPFANSESVSKAPFDLVHSDLWGPAPIQSVNGYKYYVTYVDDYTRYTWIYLLKLKSEVYGTFIHFHNMVQTQFKTKVKVVQSDGGSEYKPLSVFFKDNGILHRISCPYTPQQNGCAERKHMHVVEMGLALLAQSNMPLKFWDDSFTTAVHLINRLPAKPIHFISPFQKLFEKKPDYSMLKVFGCLAYPHMRPYNNHKLEFRAEAGVFIGYSSEYKGYKILLSTGKVIVSRHVVFEENIFPFVKEGNAGTENIESSKDVFSSCEPTVASFPAFTSQNLQVEASSNKDQHPVSSFDQSDSCSDKSLETVPLEVYLPVSRENLPDSISQHGFENDVPITNKHSMVTRSKAGIYKPKILTAVLRDLDEPKSAEEAMMKPHWKKAMKDEYEALLKNKTWTLTTLPKGANLIGNRWVFKVKKNADGGVERYKARLVAQGFTQTTGFDYQETFSPVIKPTTIRIMLSLALNYSWKVRQLDVSNAFLNGELTEQIYMRQPKGFEQEGTYVCKLHKALYGLKQASRAWYMKVKNTLSSFGFENSKADSSLFWYDKNGLKVYILIYVDDILVTGNCEKGVDRLIERMRQHFSLKDLGEINHFLGIEVSRTQQGFHLCQKEYIKKLLEKANMQQAKYTPTPMISSSHLSRHVGTPVKDPQLYRSVVGALHYVTITRPEISFAVNKVSQYMANPLEPHWKAVKRILRYLGGSTGYGLNFCKSEHLNITDFSDSDWATDIDDRRSITGYCVYIGQNLVSWSSKKQQCVSRSSTEAEYRSLAQVISEISWIQHLLDELKVVQTRIPQVWIDNQSAIYLSSNPILHARTKHIELDYHFIREKVAAGKIQVNYVPSSEQNANILTKPLSLQFFTRLRRSLTVDLHPMFELRGRESQAC